MGAMAAPPLSPEHERELAALRARAYGPDVDAALDSTALARLAQLESMARSDAPATVPLASESTTTGEPAADGAASVVVEAPPSTEENGEPIEAAADAERPATPPVPWRRRVTVWAYVVGAAAIGVGIGLAVPGLVSPRPDAVLRMSPQDGESFSFGLYGIEALAPQRYEQFRELEVWSSEIADGAICLLVTTTDGEWAGAGCAPRPLDPIADVTLYPDNRAIEGLDLPFGSTLRFILREGAVQVWIDENVEQT